MAVSLTYPNKRVFAFSPSPLYVTGAEIGQQFTITFNGITVIRYADPSGKLYFPLEGAFQSFFKDIEKGNVEIIPGYQNTGSKYVIKDALITVFDGTTTTNLTFDILYGALQLGETENTVETIYQYGALPLTITQTLGVNFIGSDLNFHSNASDSFGKEIIVSNYIGKLSSVIIQDATPTTLKTYKIIHSDCENGVYLRWLSLTDGYKYDLLTLSQDDMTDKSISTFNTYNQSLAPSANGLLKGDVQTKSHETRNTLTLGNNSCDETKTKHLQSLLASSKVWMYSNGNWIEVTKSDVTITKKRTDGNREVTIKILPPKYYNQHD